MVFNSNEVICFSKGMKLHYLKLCCKIDLQLEKLAPRLLSLSLTLSTCQISYQRLNLCGTAMRCPVHYKFNHESPIFAFVIKGTPFE